MYRPRILPTEVHHILRYELAEPGLNLGAEKSPICCQKSGIATMF